MCAVEEGVLTAFGDVDGSLSKRRRGGEEGQREQEEEDQREGGGAHPPTAHPPTLWHTHLSMSHQKWCKTPTHSSTHKETHTHTHAHQGRHTLQGPPGAEGELRGVNSSKLVGVFVSFTAQLWVRLAPRSVSSTNASSGAGCGGRGGGWPREQRGIRGEEKRRGGGEGKEAKTWLIWPNINQQKKTNINVFQRGKVWPKNTSRWIHGTSVTLRINSKI